MLNKADLTPEVKLTWLEAYIHGFKEQARVLRCSLFEGEDLRHTFQLSGKRFNLSPAPWTGSPQNQLVFIGGQLNPLQLHQQISNCLTGSRSRCL